MRLSVHRTLGEMLLLHTSHGSAAGTPPDYVARVKPQQIRVEVLHGPRQFAVVPHHFFLLVPCASAAVVCVNSLLRSRCCNSARPNSAAMSQRRDAT